MTQPYNRQELDEAGLDRKKQPRKPDLIDRLVAITYLTYFVTIITLIIIQINK